MAFEKYILPGTDDPKMPVHGFCGLLAEYLDGKKTAPETKTEIERVLDVTLSADESQDITNTISYINAGADAFQKRARMDEVYRVCILAECEMYYGTQELLRARLNWTE